MKVPTEFNRKSIGVPASKSDSQRAILAASLVKSSVAIKGIGDSKDELAMLENVVSTGAKITEKNGEVHIEGSKEFPETLSLNCGESGLGSRLMTSMCIVHSGEFFINGEGSLLDRPFEFFTDTFESKITLIEDNKGKLPLKIQGGFVGGELTVSGKQSSQYISGLLMALPLAKNESVLHVEELNSTPYVEMTLKTLRHFGIIIENQGLKKFVIPGNQEYRAEEYTIERDWSSAAFWLVASALGKDIWLKDLSMSSLQADKSILDVFLSANCSVQFEDNMLRIDGKNRNAFECDLTQAPDLFPALAAFAALTEGQSKLVGLHRLTDKESDRGKTIQSEFEKIGVKVDLDYENDVLICQGSKSIKGGKASSCNDHRIAMCLGILGLFSESKIEVENSDAVMKSYPVFWEELKKL
ncbi:MAG: 3-phosphoshikimate 1-carboxyvinyltransferase [Crocinitomicaceae bacterium]|jgi:3-phosphoshikimate 1-carboxyvinyltransferase|nr:3-phosphoshikimate 1-carboxyvinyltransferase [Crocinitomicaceae bacterium]